MLVALAASLSDGAVAIGPSLEGSVAWRVAASSRAVAAALSTVADQLEDEWNADGWRHKPTPALAGARLAAVVGDLYDRPQPVRSAFRRHDERVALTPSTERHVRLANNVPPPSGLVTRV
ncbi:MAG: hypothetical protein JNM94_07775 [Phycisphaerae bacterium]|nr:hypothetical protein [Phycisphaerae bacterium]